MNTKSKISSSDQKSFTVLYLKLFAAGSLCDVWAECVQVTSLPIVAKSNSNVKNETKTPWPSIKLFLSIVQSRKVCCFINYQALVKICWGAALKLKSCIVSHAKVWPWTGFQASFQQFLDSELHYQLAITRLITIQNLLRDNHLWPAGLSREKFVRYPA